MRNKLVQGKVCFWGWQKETLLHGVKRMWNEEVIPHTTSLMATSPENKAYKADVFVYQDDLDSMRREKDLRSVVWDQMRVVEQKDIVFPEGDQLGLF